jgi:uncharacterized protein (DUF885 family)
MSLSARLLVVIAFIVASPVAAQQQDFEQILRDYESLAREADPVAAGRRGDESALRLWPDVRPAALKRRHERRLELQRRLQTIDPGPLSAGTALDHGLLVNRLKMEIESYAFGEERIPFISGDGFFTVPDYAAFGTVVEDEADAAAWIARLEALPNYYAANVSNMRRGLKSGFTQPRQTAEKAVASIRSQLAQPAEQSSLLGPLRSLPASMPQRQQNELRQTAIRLIGQNVRPAQQTVLTFLEREYLPRTRRSVGIREVPAGRDYYDHLIRRNTTTGLTADQVHELGLTEVARIRTQMEAAKAEAGFRGTMPEFLKYLRTEPRFYAPSVDAYTQVAAEIAKRVDAKIPQFIGKLSRLTFGLKRLPPEVENTSSGYWAGDPETGRSGSILIHGDKVLKFPLFQLPAWVVHEGVPGHHTQIALAQELEDVSEFRRNEDITAFVEGWALYTERLGEEMGIYRDAYEKFGRLSYEAWRASRLVIDTGIHARGWSRDRAISYLTENTALSDLEVRGEIDRYIAWPGQALAYKIGELTIRRVRARAETALGASFDIRGFHDALLSNGPITLDMLDRQMATWTAAQLARAGELRRTVP